MKKILKERIVFEKFEENSDPLYDLGIGITSIINDCVERIFDLDFQNYTLDEDEMTGCINHIYIDENNFVIRHYSNHFLQGDSEDEKLENYHKYLINLTIKAGIFDLFKSISYNDKYYSIIFKIKPEVVKYFSNINNRDYDEHSYFWKRSYFSEISVEDFKRWR